MPEGWLGKGRSSYTQHDPPTFRGPAVMGETLEETVGEGHRGTEGNGASAFPLRHQGACWAPVPKPLLLEPPSYGAEPKPCPYTPTQGPTSTLGDPPLTPLPTRWA